MLDRVVLRHDEFIIERKGKPLAALVPMEQMRQFARQHALGVLQRQKSTLGDRLTDEETMALAMEAQRVVRRQGSRTKRSRK